MQALTVRAATLVQTEPVVVRIGYYALLLWAFLYFSRLLDITYNNLKIMMLLNLVWLGAAFLSGGIVSLVTTRVGLAFSAFFCWTIVCLPFSVWKGGSVESVKLTLRALLLMGAIMAVVKTTRDCLRLMYVIGFALGLAGIVSRFAGESTATGRLALAAGTFADPNFYCMALLIGLPFLLLRATLERGFFNKAIPIAAMVPLLLAAVATGSRSGMLALLTMFTVYFIRSSARMRVYLLAGATACVVLISTVASDYILARFTTMFSSGYDESLSAQENRNLSGAAVGSAQARKYLLKRSIELTLKNPIVGVGPGMFPVAEAEDAKELNLEETWHETHNTYTQISSETGIPGLIFYGTALIIGLRTLSRLSKLKPRGPDRHGFHVVRQSALYLQLSLITLMVGAIFLSFAYSSLFFALIGLTAVLERSALRELVANQPQMQPLQPVANARSRIPARVPAGATRTFPPRPLAGRS
jgi:hypothetical protein